MTPIATRGLLYRLTFRAVSRRYYARLALVRERAERRRARGMAS